MSKYCLPHFGLNGSNPENIREEFMVAWRSVNASIENLRVCEVNGRDFNPDEFIAAKFEKAEALAKLSDVLEYVEEWIMHADSKVKD